MSVVVEGRRDKIDVPSRVSDTPGPESPTAELHESQAPTKRGWRERVRLPLMIGIPVIAGAQFSLLPPENATGNWVKVVQRLPVRLQLQDSVPVQSGLSALVTVDTHYRHGLFGLEAEQGKTMSAKAAE